MKNWMKRHKILTGVIVVLLILLLSAVGFVWSKLNRIQYDDGGVDTAVSGQAADAETEEQAQPPVEKEDENVLNVLVIGTDERTKSFSTNARSDSMMLVSFNKKERTVKLVSLERAIGVPVLEGQYKGQEDWLTHIFRYGGAKLLLRTVRECFGLDVDRYVRVNFGAVIEAVNAVGGIDVDLSEIEATYLSAGVDLEGIRMPQITAGPNHLNGQQALRYARLREPDSDWRRIERQRTVAVACIVQARKASMLELNEIANRMLPLVQTNFSKREIVELMIMAPGFLEANTAQMTIPAPDTFGHKLGMGGRSLFDVDFETNSKLLHEFLYSKKK